MKRIAFLIISLVFFQGLFAESNIKNYIYAKRDTCSLSMDVYTPVNISKNTPCLVFVFGGGFAVGSKSGRSTIPYLKAMADNGFVVVSIDYRLGMKGVKAKGIKALKLFRNAINMAVEDLYDATGYLLKNAQELSIDPAKIIISGSSAGAITVLQADYELCNRTALASVLPTDFHYAGVISFAGGILSFNGVPNYHETPAPTLFFHGLKDKKVPYNKIQFLKTGFFGINALVKVFEKHDYPYFAYRYRDMGHEIAGIPMNQNQADICSFISDYVIKKKNLKKDITVKNPYLKRADSGKKKLNNTHK